MGRTVKQLIEDRLAEIGEAGNKGLLGKSFMFLADNQFFGSAMEEDGGTLKAPEQDAEDLGRRLSLFLAHRNEEKGEKLLFLKKELAERFPETMRRMTEFQSQVKGPMAEDNYQLYDFMASRLETEVHLMDNGALDRFAKELDASSSKVSVEVLAFFTGWMKKRYPVSYSMEIRVEKRTSNCATEAYSLNTICELYYLCFNQERIDEDEMFKKACADPRYADTILNLSIHLLCSLRDPDIARLPLPEVADPGDILDRISAGSLPDEEAVMALRSVMNHLGCIAPVPNKTRAAAGIPEVYLFIPASLEAHFGKLFLICEAHRLQSGRPFLSGKATGYWELRSLLGSEMAEPFRERDICPTAFSKSFMQGLAIMAGQMGEGGALQRAMLGYQLASRARSHKSAYGSFATMTADYLNDNALTGLGPSIVANELYERGVLSSIPSMLLSLVFPGEFENLAFTGQTKMIQALGLDAFEAERVMDLFTRARAKARETILEVIGMPENDRKKEICSVLRSMAAGSAPGKDGGVFCFMTALDRPCPFPCLKHCLGCRFRIDTRATLFQLGAEYGRIVRVKKEARCPGEKLKYECILDQYLFPTFVAALSATTEEFGKEAGEYLMMTINEAGRVDDKK